MERDLQASQEAGGEKNGECGGCGGELGEIVVTVVAPPNMETFNRFSPVLRKPSWNTTPSTEVSGPLMPWQTLLRWVLLNPNHLLEGCKH